MKIIDLLNKIANGKKLPKRIKWRDKIWDYIEKEQDYINHNIYFFEGFTQIRTKDFVTDTVEIIEDEDEDINIQGISALPEWGFNDDDMRDVINNLIKAVKKLDNQKRQWIEDRDNKHKDSEIIYAIEVLQSLLEKE